MRSWLDMLKKVADGLLKTSCFEWRKRLFPKGAKATIRFFLLRRTLILGQFFNELIKGNSKSC